MTRLGRCVLLAGLGALVSLIGCTTMNVTPLQPQPTPQVEGWEAVTIYEDRTEIDAPYREVALLEVNSARTKEKLLHDCQCRAAAMGANGILVERIQKHSESDWCEIANVPVMIAHDAWDGRVLAILVTPE